VLLVCWVTAADRGSRGGPSVGTDDAGRVRCL